MDAEKRRSTRAEVKTRCAGTIHSAGTEIAVTLRNISTAGARLDLESELSAEVGDQVRLELATPFGVCACQARLVWKREGAVGVQFTELPIEEDDPLNRFVHAPGILHWMWRTFWDIDDRRIKERSYLTTFCPVSIVHEGRERSASMRNLSYGGALLHVSFDLDIRPGVEIDLVVKTPYGDSRCRARVSWIDRADDGRHAGVEFLDLTPEQSEPLRALMDSPF